jgi:hypothetical protein
MTDSTARGRTVFDRDATTTGCCIIRKGNQTIRIGGITEAECEARARQEGGTCIWKRGEQC